jgi:hypothetical protein
MTIEKLETPRGDGARSMTSLASPSYDVRVNGQRPYSGMASFTGSDWFGPLQPIQPIAPRQVAGRVWDYVPGYNLATQPRAYEQISFHTLRALAESFDPVRLVIERCRIS